MRRDTQCDRLLRLLRNSRYFFGEWVTLHDILSLHIASHTKIISLLRKKGNNIEIDRQNKADGQMWTRYRLVSK